MVFRGELIGSNVEIVKAKNIALVGVNGKVVDETRNMIILENSKMVGKKNVWLKVIKDKTSFELDGNTLIGRAEDRLKKVYGKNE